VLQRYRGALLRHDRADLHKGVRHADRGELLHSQSSSSVVRSRLIAKPDVVIAAAPRLLRLPLPYAALSRRMSRERIRYGGPSRSRERSAFAVSSVSRSGSSSYSQSMMRCPYVRRPSDRSSLFPRCRLAPSRLPRTYSPGIALPIRFLSFRHGSLSCPSHILERTKRRPASRRGIRSPVNW